MKHSRATARRLPGNPILRNFMEPRMGSNVNGPSLLRTRPWMTGRLGRYHLYFAHHLGSYIRLAFADALEGPWRVHAPGVLDIAQMPWIHEHCASPDVHVDEDARQIRMYFHGIDDPDPWENPRQSSFVALSSDGLSFTPHPERLGASYFRVWAADGVHYALSLGGQLWRGANPLAAFTPGPVLAGLPQGTRHLAVLPSHDDLWVAWSVIGDRPERIMAGRVDTRAAWTDWFVTDVCELLRPEHDWEGAALPLLPSEVGLASTPVRQLRDPAFYSEAGRDYLLYSAAGEAGIAIAEFTHQGAR